MITNMMQRISLPITNAPTKIRMMEPKNTMVAPTRTGLNMSFSCLVKPIRNPVPIRATIVPSAYSSAKLDNDPRNRNMAPSKLSTNPAPKHPTKPYSLCVLVRPKNENAESPSKNCVSGTTLVADSRLNHPLDDILGIIIREVNGQFVR